jgi:hypothetical protein
VPEASVNKYCEALPSKDDIGTYSLALDNDWIVLAKPEAAAV